MRGENKSFARNPGSARSHARTGDRIYRTPGSMLPRGFIYARNLRFRPVSPSPSLTFLFFFFTYTYISISLFFKPQKLFLDQCSREISRLPIDNSFGHFREEPEKTHPAVHHRRVHLSLSRVRIHKITRISFRGRDESGLNRLYTRPRQFIHK